MIKTNAAHKALKADPVMAHLIDKAQEYVPDTRLQQTTFEVLARAIAHQQLHSAAARNILQRFVGLFDAAFPLPQDVIDAEEAQLRAAGFSRSKIAALKDLAAKALTGVVPEREALDSLSDDEIVERLTEVRGIGRWTVEMLLMFSMQRPDVLPVDDFGVRNGFRLAYGLKGMPTPKALAQFGERWKPYRSIAAWYLWRANELAKQNLLPAPGNPPRLALQKPPQARRNKNKVAAGKKVSRKKKATQRIARKTRQTKVRATPSSTRAKRKAKSKRAGAQQHRSRS